MATNNLHAHRLHAKDKFDALMALWSRQYQRTDLYSVTYQTYPTLLSYMRMHHDAAMIEMHATWKSQIPNLLCANGKLFKQRQSSFNG